jgi:hypothetical protein
VAGKGHVGKAGQLAVMAEFLLRGYNVAMPEVDVGDDIFVVSDRKGELWRIQVKTAISKQTRNGYRGKFAVGSRQLMRSREPDLFYIFALRKGAAWEFLIIPRARLEAETNSYQVGSESGGNILYTVRSRPTEVVCANRDWSSYRDAWGEWPVLGN